MPIHLRAEEGHYAPAVLCPGDPRRAIAIMTAAFGLGQMIGPSFAGFVHQFGDSFLLPSLAASFALLVAAALVVNLRTTD